jgi:hypothetical protein
MMPFRPTVSPSVSSKNGARPTSRIHRERDLLEHERSSLPGLLRGAQRLLRGAAAVPFAVGFEDFCRQASEVRRALRSPLALSALSALAAISTGASRSRRKRILGFHLPRERLQDRLHRRGRSEAARRSVAVWRVPTQYPWGISPERLFVFARRWLIWRHISSRGAARLPPRWLVSCRRGRPLGDF